MPNRLKDINRESLHSQQNRHPFIAIPPNDLDFYAAAVAGNTLAVGGLFTIITPGWGGPSTVHCTTAGTLGAGKVVVLRIEGRDENWDRVGENLVIAGDGVTASLNIVSANLYSEVISVTVLAITGTLLATETFAIGIGNGTATPLIRIPNPVPGLTHGAGSQLATLIIIGGVTAVSTTAAPVGQNAKHMLLAYAANNNIRQAYPVFRSVDVSVFERS